MLNGVNYFFASQLNLRFTTVRSAINTLALVCSLLFWGNVRAQQTAHGIVMDRDTKQRVSRVFIYNPANDAGEFNNTKGEFTLPAKPGDVLIAAVEGYFADTITVVENRTHLFQLKRSSIRIQEVPIIVRRNPEELLQEKQREYSSAYSKGSVGPLLTVGPTGAGLNIDALYKMISREGKNARRLQEIIERDYRESVIDYRFTPELVSQATGLKGEQLRDFMLQYRPSYFFVLGTSEYNLVFYIRSSFAQYKRNPAARRLPPLTPGNDPKPQVPQ